MPDAAVRLVGVGLNPSRLAIVDVLREMGADIEFRPTDDDADSPEPVGDLVVRGDRGLGRSTWRHRALPR